MSTRSSDGTRPSITSMFSNGMARTCASCNSVSELDDDAPVRAKYASRSTDSTCHMAFPLSSLPLCFGQRVLDLAVFRAGQRIREVDVEGADVPQPALLHHP